MAAKLPDRLVVVVADHAVLRMESGESRAVVQQRPVRDQYPERLSEEVRFQEHRPRVHAGFLIHGKKLLPFLIVEAHHHAVRLAALFRMPPPFGRFIHVLFPVHLYYGFSGSFHGTGAASGTHTAGRKQASPDDLRAELKTLADTLEEVLNSSADKSKEEMGKLRSKAESALKESRARLGETSEAILRQTRETAARADDYVRENPWTGVGIGAAVGLVLGVLLSRR